MKEIRELRIIVTKDDGEEWDRLEVTRVIDGEDSCVYVGAFDPLEVSPVRVYINHLHKTPWMPMIEV